MKYFAMNNMISDKKAFMKNTVSERKWLRIK